MNRIASALVDVGILAAGLALIGLVLNSLMVGAFDFALRAGSIWLQFAALALLLYGLAALFIGGFHWLNRGRKRESAADGWLVNSLRDGGIVAGVGGALFGLYLMLAAVIVDKGARSLVSGAALLVVCFLFIRDWRRRF